MPLKHDLRLIDEHFESVYVDVISNIALSDVKTVKTIDINHKGVFSTEEPKPVMKNNFSPLIIEDWHSNDKSGEEISPTVTVKTVKPSIEKIKYVKPARETYVCDKKDVRPIRNNSNRVNHKNFANKLTQSHPKRGFVPQAILTRSGKINTIGASANTVARPVNTVGSKSTVNHPRLKSKAYKRGHSQDTRPNNKFSANKNNIFNKKVNTVRVNDSTARDRAVVNGNIRRELLDESQVLLRVPRKDNIYNVNLKSVAPTGEAVNIACNVLNRALVTKPHNKTPYELIRVRPPLIDFMKPFGCPVTILNTRDNLGKFEGKADEGYLVGYSVVSKAMRVFNKRTRIVEETLNIIVAENQTNGIAGSKENLVAGQDDKKKELKQEYILIPICTTNPLLSQGSKDNAVDAGKKAPEVDESEASDNSGKNDQVSRSEVEGLPQQARQTKNINNTKSFNNVGLPVNTVGSSFVNVASQTLINVVGPFASTNAFEEHYFEQFSPFKNAFSLPHVPIVTPIDDTGIFGNAYDDEVLEEEVDMNNVDSLYTIPKATKNKKNERGIVIKNKARFVAQGILKRKKELSTKFEKLVHDKFQMSPVGELSFFLGLQVKQKSDGIFISQDKYMAEVLKKFDFVNVKTANSPFDLKAYSNSDYAGASLARKSTTGGCQFLGKRLMIAKDKRCFMDTSKVTTANETVQKEMGDKMERAATTTSSLEADTMAYVIICLADNQKFNFSKYIFDNMVKSLEGGVKFYLFLRFLQVFLDKQVEGMASHKEMYIISSHTKKIFANMRRIEAGFSRVSTPLFDSMMVQSTADMGDTPVETHQTPIVDQPSTSKPQKKQQHRRKQRKEAEVSHDELEDEDHVLTPSSDSLPSGEDSFILNELMVFCTSLQEQKVKSGGLKRLKKIGSGRRVKSPMDKDGLGRTNDDEMFGVDDRAREEVVMENTTGDKDSAAPTTNVTEDEIVMAQALAALKSTKPKVVVQAQEMSTTITAAATIITTAIQTLRAKGIVFHEKKKSQIPTVSSSKDKGKAKMIEPEVPFKKKDQMRID
nr:ribonuclease H-like domain-containing protein [Tanacetum cinerariifolium]